MSSYEFKKIFSFYLVISLFILLFVSYQFELSVFAKDDNSKKKDKDKYMNLKVKINNKNVEFENVTKIKIISYVNGEAKIEYLNTTDFKLYKKNKHMKVNFEFNKNNEISEIGVKDEYFVCGYIINEKDLNNNILFYDCDEGFIQSEDKNTARLFSTVNKYDKSSNFYNINKDGDDQDNEVIQIMVIVPIYDRKDIELMNVIAMIRGEYQIKTLDIQQELDDIDDKDKEDYIIKVPFTFDRNTIDLGKIQLGDMFFGCATADKLYPPERTECEKRLIKKFDKYNEIVVRHEEDINR